ncbi:MAG TPA: hypothetical protein VGI57_03800 [Usitatibacter sp.]
MRRLLAAAALLLVLGNTAGCASSSSSKNSSEREWARAECRNIIDSEARAKCLERVDKE